jgi:hypothetical protein
LQALEWNIELWTIPSHVDLSQMESLLMSPEYTHDFMDESRHAWMNWSLSACAVAIDALSQLDPHTLRNMQSIVLHEDSIVVNWPECYAQGLVSLLTQNPKLQVQRRVKPYSVRYLSRMTAISTSGIDSPLQYVGNAR